MQSFPAIPFLLFLCSPKESLRQASKKELVRFLEREQTSPKVTEQKEMAFAAGEKNPVHYASLQAERRNPLRFASFFRSSHAMEDGFFPLRRMSAI